MADALIYIRDPKLIKDYYLRDQDFDFEKIPTFMSVLKSFTGGGILFDEGETWHRRRRILNRVFNFDVIKNSSDKIRAICQKEFLEA